MYMLMVKELRWLNTETHSAPFRFSTLIIRLCIIRMPKMVSAESPCGVGAAVTGISGDIGLVENL